MKVNIHGKGLIPNLGLAPKFGVDLNESEIRSLLNFSMLRVYEASTGNFINKKNVDNFFKIKDISKQKKVKQNAPEEKPITSVIEESVGVFERLPEIPENVDVVTTELFVSNNINETTESDIIIDEISASSIEETVVSDKVDAVIEVPYVEPSDEVGVTTTEESKSNNNNNSYNRKKKNKKRNS